MLFIGLLLSGVSAELGCIREHNVLYSGDGTIAQVAAENAQACADHCASLEECLFWTWKKFKKTCTVRNSVPSREGAFHTDSGNRECGLLHMWEDPGNRPAYLGKTPGMTIGTLLPKAVTIGSQRPVNSSPDECGDGKVETSCTVAASPAPWLALDFGKPTQVNRVDLVNSKSWGGRLWDFEVRVTNTLPTSAETMFKDGTLLASYQGSVVAAEWQAITIEYPPSGPQPEGRYVLLQQNKNQILEVRSIVASFEASKDSETPSTHVPNNNNNAAAKDTGDTGDTAKDTGAKLEISFIVLSATFLRLLF